MLHFPPLRTMVTLMVTLTRMAAAVAHSSTILMSYNFVTQRLLVERYTISCSSGLARRH